MSDPPRSPSRAANLLRVLNETRRVDPRMLPLAVGAAVAVLVVSVAVALLVVDSPLVRTAVIVGGVLLAALAALQVFSRRATSAAMRNLEGRSGAAAAVLSSLRRPWRVTPAIAFNRRQDFVHLAVGRPGVVLVAEGAASGATALLKQERRRVARVVGEVPIHEVVVGDGAGQVPLHRLSTHFLRLPRSIKPAEIDGLDSRLKALGASSPQMPKGPMPKSRRPR